MASAFSQLQENRHIADYDLSKTWSGAEVALEIGLVEEALTSWDTIRDEEIAQDYLFSLLFKERS